MSTLLLFYVVPVKSKVEILQNFVAFSEYLNFKTKLDFNTTNQIQIYRHHGLSASKGLSNFENQQ